MVERIPMSLTGNKRLREELERLERTERPDIVKAIEVARAHGDLSENAEYHAAKEEQAIVNGRINEISLMLKGVDIVDPAAKQAGVVSVGSKFRVKNSDREHAFTIVGANESDPSQGLISNESPIAAAMMGKKAGDTVEVVLPDETVKYKIISVE